MLGYAEMSAERFDQAITHLKRSLALNKLPEKVKYNVGYMVAQLHAAQNDFDAALAFAAEWFETLEDPSPPQMMFMAKHLRPDAAIQGSRPFCRTGPGGGGKARETWYQLLTAAYLNSDVTNKPLSPYSACCGCGRTSWVTGSNWPAFTWCWSEGRALAPFALLG